MIISERIYEILLTLQFEAYINTIYTYFSQIANNVQFSHISFRSYTLTIISYYFTLFLRQLLVMKRKENYISLLMTKMLQFPPPGHVVHSYCQTHNNVHVMTTTESNSFQLVFLTKSDWCSIFYSCFMPFPIKSNERKLMNVHVQIKCYIMLLTIKGPKLVIIYPQLNNTIINRMQKNYLRLFIIS